MTKRHTTTAAQALITQEIAYLAERYPEFLPRVMTAIAEDRLIRGAVIQVEQEQDGTLVVVGDFYGHGTGMVAAYEARLHHALEAGVECLAPTDTKAYWDAYAVMAGVARRQFPERDSDLTPIADYLALHGQNYRQAVTELKNWISPYLRNCLRDPRDFRLPAYLEEVAS